jgi:hypothetical protein
MRLLTLASALCAHAAVSHAETFAASGNFGFAAPSGILGFAARMNLPDNLFVEGDLGWGISGREVGGGMGIAYYRERARTNGLGMANARATATLLFTRSQTNEREAGQHSDPLPELVQGGGTYYWGYLMFGGDVKFDSHLYLLAEIGLVARLARAPLYPMDPEPDDRYALNIRAGVGAHF